MMARVSGAPHIHKFGGASLADAPGVRRAVEIVLAYRPAPQVVVVSAMGGVTDALLEAARGATRGERAQVRAGGEFSASSRHGLWTTWSRAGSACRRSCSRRRSRPRAATSPTWTRQT